MALRERRFGVEIECGFGELIFTKKSKYYKECYDSGYWFDADDDGYCYYQSDKDPKAIGYEGATAVEFLLRNSKLPKAWANEIDEDGSGVEIRSPILQGAEGFRQLKYCMDLLVRKGAFVTKEDGLHIHHDAPEFKEDKELQGILAESWYNNQEIIEKMVAADRRDGYYCPRLAKEIVDDIKAGAIPWERFALNISAVREHGTIEIRQHEGTLDFYQAKAWIRFGQAFIDYVVKTKNPLKKTDNTIILLKRVRTARTATDKLIDKTPTQRAKW